MGAVLRFFHHKSKHLLSLILHVVFPALQLRIWRLQLSITLNASEQYPRPACDRWPFMRMSSQLRFLFYLIKHGLHYLHTKIPTINASSFSQRCLQALNNHLTKWPICHFLSFPDWKNWFLKQSFMQALSRYSARLGEGHTLGLLHSEFPLLCHILPLAFTELNNK